MGTTGTATTITWMNIGGTNGSGGTGTIIDTITMEIMIGTATGIDLLRGRMRYCQMLCMERGASPC